MASFNSIFRKPGTTLRWIACGLMAAAFAWNAAQFYLPGKGFTYLIEFGDREHAQYLPELRAVNHFEQPNSSGYDSQAYAQIAMRPHLGDPVLAHAVDSLPYRARRILFCWTAWLIGGGNPVLAMNIYAVQNIGCWFLLALLLFRWLPPSNWGNVGRWAAVLFSFGMAFSVRGALVDGPSLLLIAGGIALLESGRPWMGSALLGIAGLGKETNILAGVALESPGGRGRKAWRAWLLQGALVLLPLAVWILCLRLWLGHGGDVGARNFAMPFAGIIRKFGDTLADLLAHTQPPVAKFSLAALIGLIAQFAFFALRPRWRDPWWRVGAAYAFLMVFLGNAVWEGYPGAAARVLLPMTLAFNLRVPKGRAWALLLLVGNLGIIGSFDLLQPPGRESYAVEGPRRLKINPGDGQIVEAIYRGNWYMPEKSRLEYWVWSSGPAAVAIRNPHPGAILADITFGLRSNDERVVTVLRDGRVLWTGTLHPAEVSRVSLPETVLAHGDTILSITTDRPGAYAGNGDLRMVAFSLRNLNLVLSARP